MGERLDDVAVVVLGPLLPLASPAWLAGPEVVEAIPDVEPSTAVQAKALGRLEEIPDDAGRIDALPAVDLVLEQGVRGAVLVEHEVASDLSAGVGEAGGEGAGRGEQQELGRLDAIGREHHRLGALEDLLLVLVVVGDTGDAASRPQLDPADVAIGPDLAS